MAKLVCDKLREKILANMPEDLTNLEKAIFIYDRMCHTLEYALDFYADSDIMGEFYANPANISLVDGENNKSVVCYTFKEIFFELCHDVKVITDEFYENIRLTSKRFHEFAHDERSILIDGESWDFDAAEGILSNCDLTMAKYSTFKYKSWEPYYETEEQEIDMRKRLNAAMDKICINSNLDKAAEQYYSIKLEDKSYIELPLKKRIEIFFQLITSPSAPSHSILGLNYILQLKQALFSNEELNGTTKMVGEGHSYNVERYVGLLFVYDKFAEQFKTIFAYNPLGYNDAKGFENFDSLLLFEIDQKSKTIQKVGMEDLKTKFDSGEYCERSTTSNRDIPSNNNDLLMRNGRIEKTFRYEGGKAIYDNHQKPTNLLEVVVTYLDGKNLTLTPEQFEMGAY